MSADSLEMMSNNISHRIVSYIAAVFVSLTVGQPLSAEGPVSWRRDVRPILAEHCFQCHGPDEAALQADLRLDIREVALESGAIVQGEPDDSELLARITADDPDSVMPPPDQKNALTRKEITTLRQWISEGAPYSSHWAFAPPRPETFDNCDANPIDHLVVRRLVTEGLEMSERSPLPVLCRRIHLDLTGLPPSPEEVDDFASAAAIDLTGAVDSLVDRLLASQHYGEKWARHWLDVARYADSNGYEKDLRREQWAWRDWVIRAINADMPYNQFLIEQIAGDLLPDPTQDQIVATGFLRNGMINEEGAIIVEQFRIEGLFDRMDCIGKAVLGLSIQCAQCHSHKFDPISHDEYYGMFAFLNDTYEAKTWVYSPQQLEQIRRIETGIDAIEAQIRASIPDWQEQLAAWGVRQLAASRGWTTIDPQEHIWVGGTNHPRELADHSIVVLGNPTVLGEMYIVGSPKLDKVTGLRLEALTYGDLPFGGPGRDDWGRFAISELRVEVKPPAAAAWQRIEIGHASADFAESDRMMPGDEDIQDKKKQRRIGPASYLVDGKETTAWRADRGPARRNTDSVAVLEFEEPLSLPEGSQLKVSLVLNHSELGGDTPAFADLDGDGDMDDVVKGAAQLGRMRFALTRSPDPRATSFDHAAMLALRKRVEDRVPGDELAIFAAWRRSVPRLREKNDEIDRLQQQRPEAQTSVLRLAARRGAHRRQTSLLDRGAWDRPRHRVQPHVPAVLHPPEPRFTKRPTRLDFARWLADSRSPLTARVQVNRVWQAVFGEGLVTTPEDFGTRAPQPEYLDVLDTLALQFIKQGWSNKSLLRTIIHSDTYQQTSRIAPHLLEVDPGNRLLARGPRFRAEAEVVRDLALSVSGLLNLKVGGPSVFPPVPKSVLDYNYTKPNYWVAPDGPERYRRAIYVFRKRSMPDPTLTSFDAPNADAACARRVRSNTPLAGLVSLNEPIFVEAARALALRILRDGGSTDAQRVDYGFRLCTGRRSAPNERAALVALLESRRRRFTDGPLSANEVATGDPEQQPMLPAGVTPQDAAAWTIAARVLLNLDETLCKN
jgi:mono/diheme cytochrome c family protein